MKYLINGQLAEAHQFDGSSSGKSEMQSWITHGVWHPHPVRTRDVNRSVMLQISPYVTRVAVAHDWVVRFENGAVFLCPAEVFPVLFPEVNRVD